MKTPSICSTILVCLLAASVCGGAPATTANSETDASRRQWTLEKAWAWYKKRPWIVGFNFVPSTACNTVEFWQKESFDPATIDRELGMGAGLGFNSCRVFLQYIVWKDDPQGLKQRLDQFLALADKHGITTTLVLFDDCVFGEPWQTEPFLGKQRDPIPGMIAPSWVPSPGLKYVTEKSVWPDLEKYVKDVVGAFGKDQRVLMWDLYNEPGNSKMGVKSMPLIRASFDWARAVAPSQPLTTYSMAGRLDISDVVSYHSYTNYDKQKVAIASYKKCLRPVICTEWMARPLGSRWTDLALFKQEGVGCYNWGLVNGRTQCQFSWRSKPGDPEPKVWFHDLFHKDGTPYDAAELAVIRKTTADKTMRPTNALQEKVTP